MTAKTTITMPPKVKAFADLLRTGAYTQAELVAKTGYSPKSISNLISTVHNRPGLVTKEGRGIPGFNVARHPDSGLRTYTIGEATAKSKKRARKAKAKVEAPVTPEVTETAPATE